MFIGVLIMKNKIYLVLTILLSAVSITLVFKIVSLKKKDTCPIEEVTSITGNSVLTEKKINEISNKYKYKIKAYYPYTSYNVLNKNIEEKINSIVKEFKKGSRNHIENQYYTLDINYDKYEYKNYISYVFHISNYLGGAHPDNKIWTIIYDKDNNRIIDINTLIMKNSGILSLLSKESKKELLNDSRFKNSNDKFVEDMMSDGTRPKAKSFKNFAFTDKGLLLFFEPYQVAPYSYGEFEITIPYKNLKLNY